MSKSVEEEKIAKLQRQLLEVTSKADSLVDDKRELERIVRDQRSVIDALRRQNDLLGIQRKNAEESARILHSQCKSAQTDLSSLVAVLNSELDIAMSLFSSNNGKQQRSYEIRVVLLAQMLDSLGLLDKFNKPRWEKMRTDYPSPVDRSP